MEQSNGELVRCWRRRVRQQQRPPSDARVSGADARKRSASSASIRPLLGTLSYHNLTTLTGLVHNEEVAGLGAHPIPPVRNFRAAGSKFLPRPGCTRDVLQKSIEHTYVFPARPSPSWASTRGGADSTVQRYSYARQPIIPNCTTRGTEGRSNCMQGIS
jgi:hypothetical protein